MISSDTRQCPSCGETGPPEAKFCFECGTRLDDAAPAQGSGERRHVTVLFADLSGYTAYSERTDPEQVRALADDAARVMGDIVERYGGMVDKVIGDAVMAVFGAPIAHEDDPERAVRASIDMQEYFSEHRDRFARMPLSIGINTGEAMFAPVGADGRYTVIGDTVNTAARLQGAADKSTTIVGEATHRATSEAIEYEDIEPVTAKNKAEPVLAWRVVGIRGARRGQRTRRAALVGREAELHRVLELWDRARAERRPYACAVLGPPGIGKSRLVGEVTERLAHSALVLRGRCLSYGEGITYWPVIEILKQAAGILHDDPLEAVTAKLDTFLEGLGTDNLDELRTMAGAVSNLLGVSTTPRGTYLTTDISRGELHWGLRRLLELTAEQVPVVLVIEDLHWAEPTLLELVEYIVDGARAPVVMMGTARPEFADQAPDLAVNRDNRRVIELPPLAATDSEALAADLLGLERLPEGPVGDVLRKAAGNPLFLEETVRMLADEGLIAPDGTLRPEAAQASVDIPSNVTTLIGSRLDRVGDGERQLLLQAAIVGDVFWTGAVEHLAGRAGVDDGLSELERRGLIQALPEATLAGEQEWRFHHALVREVAYGRLAKADRFTLHQRCADWVTGLPDGDEELVEIVAHHLEQACLLAADVRTREAPPVVAAMRALTRAGEKADHREGTREAARFYERALALAGDRYPETSAELRFKRAQKLAVLGDLDLAQAELRATADAAGLVDRIDVRGRALVDLANIEHALGLATEARHHLGESIELAGVAGDAHLEVHSTLAWAAFAGWFDGAVEESAGQLQTAIAQADELDDPELRVLGRLHLAMLFTNEGRFAEAERAFEQCRRIGHLFGTVRFEALAVGLLANVKYYRGPRSEAVDLCHMALEWFERAAHQHTEAQVLKTLGMVALAEDRPVEAGHWLDKAMPLAEPLGGWLLSEICRFRTAALVGQGWLDEARAMVAQGWVALPEEDAYARSSVLIADAILRAAEGDEPRARDGFNDALDLLTELSRTVDLADARVDYARACLLFGDVDSARQELEVARAEFSAMGARAAVDDLEAMLARDDGAAVRAS